MSIQEKIKERIRSLTPEQQIKVNNYVQYLIWREKQAVLKKCSIRELLEELNVRLKHF